MNLATSNVQVKSGGQECPLHTCSSYSAGRSTIIGCGFLGSALGAGGTADTEGTTGTPFTAARESLRLPVRSSHLPKIILPAVVCSTDVTEMSMVLPIIFLALSTTTMVPSSR